MRRTTATPTAPETANMPLLPSPLPPPQPHRRLHRAGLPVLRHTVRAFEELRSADPARAREIAAVVLADPLMTLRLLTHLGRTGAPRRTTTSPPSSARC